jgi:hypothetical protein
MKFTITPSRFWRLGCGTLVLGVGAAILCAYSPDLETSLPKPVSHTQQWFGNSAAVDDLWAAVGAPGELLDPADPSSPMVGAVHAYRRSAVGWAHHARVTSPSAEVASQFGASVAVSGSLLVVGAYLADAPQDGSGAVYVYSMSDAGVTLDATLVPSDSHSSQTFGYPVKVRGDRLIAGALGDNEVQLYSGAAYVFRLDAGAWVQEGKLKAPAPNWDEYFGWWADVAGTTAVVGAPYAAVQMSDGSIRDRAGAAYVYELAGGSWTHVATLMSSAPTPDANLGWSVSVDGEVVAAGSPYGGAGFGGTVEVFRRGVAGWAPEAMLEADDAEAGAQLGYDVAVRGTTLVAGAPADSTVGGVVVQGGGSVYVFDYAAGAWSFTTEVASASRTQGENSGYSVGFDGRSLAVGAPRQVPAGCSGNCSEFGVAYVFEQNRAPVADASLTPTQVNSSNGVDAEVALDGSASSDPDGDTLAFTWTEGGQVLGQAAVVPVTLSVGTHTLQLLVSDGRADSTTAVTVEVIGVVNRPPEARVSDPTIEATADGPEGAMVRLDGSASSDPDGDALTHRWLENGNLLAEGAVAEVRFSPGVHQVQLEVSDGQASSTAALVVTVMASDGGGEDENHAPIANASRTKTRVIAPDNRRARVRLDGSASSDPDGDALDYRWYEKDVKIAKGKVADVKLGVGRHSIRLIVNDGSLRDDDVVVVRVVTPGQAVRALALRVEGADLRHGRKYSALALLKSAGRAFDRGNMKLGMHQLHVFQRLLSLGGRDQKAAKPLVQEAEAIIAAVKGR